MPYDKTTTSLTPPALTPAARTLHVSRPILSYTLCLLRRLAPPGSPPPRVPNPCGSATRGPGRPAAMAFTAATPHPFPHRLPPPPSSSPHVWGPPTATTRSMTSFSDTRSVSATWRSASMNCGRGGPGCQGEEHVGVRYRARRESVHESHKVGADALPSLLRRVWRVGKGCRTEHKGRTVAMVPTQHQCRVTAGLRPR